MSKTFEGFQVDTKGCRDVPLLMRVLELATQGYFSHEIAEVVGKSPKSIQKLYRRYNFPVLQKLCATFERR